MELGIEDPLSFMSFSPFSPVLPGRASSRVLLAYKRTAAILSKEETCRMGACQAYLRGTTPLCPQQMGPNRGTEHGGVFGKVCGKNQKHILVVQYLGSSIGGGRGDMEEVAWELRGWCIFCI